MKKNKEKKNMKKSVKNFDDQTKSSGLTIEVRPEFSKGQTRPIRITKSP